MCNKKFIVAIVAAAWLTALPVQATDIWQQVFPELAMRDIVSLDMEREETTVEQLSSVAQQTYTRQQIAFTSFELNDEVWRQRAELLIPRTIPPQFSDAGVVVSDYSFGSNGQRYAEIALELGIPVLRIYEGNPGPRYGVEDEGNLMGFGLKQYLMTGDPNWHGYGWLAKIIVRGVTAMQASIDRPLSRFVVTGCSKRGSASQIALAADSRILGSFPTCVAVVDVEATLIEKARRWGLDFKPVPDQKTDAPAFVSTRQQLMGLRRFAQAGLFMLHDPVSYPERFIGKKMLVAKGTNDPLIPPLGDASGLARMPQGTRLLNVPNLAHSADSPWHHEAWRMWLLHALGGRPVPEISTHAVISGDEAIIQAQVDTETSIQSATLWAAVDEAGAYIDAQWQATPMSRRADGAFEARLATRPTAYSLYFVEVRDRDDSSGNTGVFTTVPLEFKGTKARDFPPMADPLEGL